MTENYKGSCYIGVVGSENENGECRDSIEAIERGAKDEGPHYIRATKGYEARQLHLNNWYEQTKHPYILLLDSDMRFPAHTLKRLRSFGRPYVSGLYMRRRFAPIAPVWFEYNAEPRMPMIPFTQVPSPNTIYRIGASGWGCILLHRDVVTAVKPLLKGEPEILEDDMDIHPYDLPKVIRSLKVFQQILEGYQPKPDVFKRALVNIVNEIRPLRGMKDPVGSDIRFPYFARLAGFDLYGDTGVQCDHMLNYPLAASDYAGQPAANVRDLAISMHQQVAEEYERIQKATA